MTLNEKALEAAARAIASDHYSKRFAKPADDPHVTVNVDGNWQIYLSDFSIGLPAYLCSFGDSGELVERLKAQADHVEIGIALPVNAKGATATLIEVANEAASALTAKDATIAELREANAKQAAEIERLRIAAEQFAPYALFAVSEESPGYAPTMPSAVGAFLAAFDIDTAEKRKSRMMSRLAAFRDHARTQEDTND